MKKTIQYSSLAAGLLLAGLAAGQSTRPELAIPRVVRFSGQVLDSPANPVSIRFALYAEQTGGEPLWTEWQNVRTGRDGHYSVLLGSTTAEGLRAGLFGIAQAHWIGMAVNGQPEGVRILLASAPYALKTSDADTLGGLPPAAFQLAVPSISNSAPAGDVRAASPDTGCTGITSDGTAVANQVAKFTSFCTIEPSAIVESGGDVGIGTSTPATVLDVKGTATMRGAMTMNAKGTATSAAGANSNPFDLLAAAFDSSTDTSTSQHFRWQAEALGNDTPNPSGTLNLLYALGSGTPAETGLTVSGQGMLTFAAGQPFPGAGSITGLTAGSGLTGGGGAGSVTIGLTHACATSQVLQWTGSAWACETPGAGTITGLTVGAGLSGGGFTGPITVANTGVVALAAGAGISSTGGNAPAVNLNTGYTDARYLQFSGGTLSGALSLPLNGVSVSGSQFVEEGGNVGIATASPGAPLEVAANVKISGAGSKLLFPDGTAQSTAAQRAAFVSPLQVALLKWFPAYQASNGFHVGINPYGVVFDGANIWVTNNGSNTVTKLSAATGMVIGTYPVGSFPAGLAFDGANIWVVNGGSASVTKLLAASGAIVGTYTVGNNPLQIAFDGSNMWITNSADNTVTKLSATNGALVGTYPVGVYPVGIAFDGNCIWVANNGQDAGNTVTKLLASTGALAGTYTVGEGPAGVTFDGANVWVSNVEGASVTKLLAVTGEVLGTYSVDGSPSNMSFDGANVWIAIVNASYVYKLSAATGAIEGTYTVGPPFSSSGMAFDGANIWVADFIDGTLIKL